MAFFVRKALPLGPIRINVSKSGIGVSAGATGARLGVSSTGRPYVHAGRDGLYYRKSLGGRGGRAESGTVTATSRTQADEEGRRKKRPPKWRSESVRWTGTMARRAGPEYEALKLLSGRASEETDGRRKETAAGTKETDGRRVEKAAGAEETEEKEVPDATFGAPRPSVRAYRSAVSPRPESLSGCLLGLCLVGTLLLAAFLDLILWASPVVGVLFAWLGIRVLKSRAGDAYGRLLDERIVIPVPIANDVEAEVATARASRWLQAEDARHFEQQAYLKLIEAGAATTGKDPADLDRVARAEQVLFLDRLFMRRMKLRAYRRAYVEAVADHVLTEAEEAVLERARATFGLSNRVLKEELSLLDQLRGLRAIRNGVLPRVEAAMELQSGEICHLQSEGRLLKKRVRRSGSLDREEDDEQGFVIDQAGTLFVTSKRILLVHEGRTSIALNKIGDLEVDADRKLLTLTSDGLVTPLYLTTPDALKAGGIIAALANF